MSHIKTSRQVFAEDFSADWLRERCDELNEKFKMHRKLWEYCIQTQVMHENPGSSAIGFGVGQDPIAAWLANRGVRVVASDWEDEKNRWTSSSQHSSNFQQLKYQGICSRDDFKENVVFHLIDMRNIPEIYKRGEFDLLWSSGALEHIGGREPGLQFILESMACLDKGGLAIHTTEFNYNSSNSTLDREDLALYLLSDIHYLGAQLKSQGDRLWSLRLGPDIYLPEDEIVLHHPYDGDVHLKIEVGGYQTTSLLLVVEKG